MGLLKSGGYGYNDSYNLTEWFTPEWDRPVTQLIAAICKSGECVVTASDRLKGSPAEPLATGATGYTLGEAPEPKVRKVSERVVVMLSGEGTRGHLIDEARVLAQSVAESRGRTTVLGVARALQACYMVTRKHEIESTVLMAQTGMASDEEFEENIDKFSKQTVEYIRNARKTYPLGAKFVVAGYDDEKGAQIFVLEDPGKVVPRTGAHHCAIGAGMHYANDVLLYYNHSSSDSLKKTLYIAYEAKRRSERSAGVGRMTDMRIIRSTGIETVGPFQIAVLEALYQERKNLDGVL